MPATPPSTPPRSLRLTGAPPPELSVEVGDTDGAVFVDAAPPPPPPPPSPPTYVVVGHRDSDEYDDDDDVVVDDAVVVVLLSDKLEADESEVNEVVTLRLNVLLLISVEDGASVYTITLPSIVVLEAGRVSPTSSGSMAAIENVCFEVKDRRTYSWWSRSSQ